MSGGIKIPEVPAKMTEKFFDDAVPGQEESLYDIPRQTYCTFLGEAQDEVAESDSPIAPPPNEMLLHSGVKDQDVGVTRLEVQSPTDLHSGVTSFLVKKPVIADVKIIKHEPGGSAVVGKAARFLTPPEGPPKESWSAEAINRLEILSNLKDDDLNFRFRNRTSTFVNPANAHAKQSVYIDLGEYQTLLKHDVVTEEASEKDSDNGERPYTLPQPQCYSDDTMKAVHTITQRFDSFKLRQLRVRSFRDATGHTRRRPSNTSAGRRASNAASVDGSDEEETLDGRRRSELLRQKSSVEEVENAILTERDVYRIEVFYRGQEAEVYVCRCLADVFVGASTKPSEETYHWVQTHTGVPVLLLNTGLGVKPRELILLVAQRDTALPLWQDKISYLSGYHESSPGVHMMKVSGSLSKAIQLRMMEDGAGKAFLDRFSEITSDPDDELWKISGAAEQNQVKDGRRQKKVKSQLSGSRRKRHVTKADISQPCNSTQLTKVDAKDHNFRAAFGDLLPTLKLLVNSGDPSGNQDEEFRPRLPTR